MTPTVLTPKTLQVRCGCEGGGKGALVQDDMSATLSTSQTQTVFAPVCLGDDNAKAACDVDMCGALKVGGSAPIVSCESVMPFDTTSITSPANGNHPHYGDPCHTLQAGAHAPAVVERGVSYEVRRLMPVECERLQGFPDGHTDLTGADPDALLDRMARPGMDEAERKKLRTRLRKWCKACPDTPRYKACGNSMAVPVMRWIGERIAMTEGGR